MTHIGYARVSTLHQDLDIQIARLKAEGCKVVRSEKVSGASRTGRAELATNPRVPAKGDELVVTRIDRLGRDTRDVLNLIHDVEQRGASVTVLGHRPITDSRIV
jgi:DNA invertase Pin-like site-specific DNA recombinase